MQFSFQINVQKQVIFSSLKIIRFICLTLSVRRVTLTLTNWSALPAHFPRVLHFNSYTILCNYIVLSTCIWSYVACIIPTNYTSYFFFLALSVSVVNMYPNYQLKLMKIYAIWNVLVIHLRFVAVILKWMYMRLD